MPLSINVLLAIQHSSFETKYQTLANVRKIIMIHLVFQIALSVSAVTIAVSIVLFLDPHPALLVTKVKLIIG